MGVSRTLRRTSRKQLQSKAIAIYGSAKTGLRNRFRDFRSAFHPVHPCTLSRVQCVSGHIPGICRSNAITNGEYESPDSLGFIRVDRDKSEPASCIRSTLAATRSSHKKFVD